MNRELLKKILDDLDANRDDYGHLCSLIESELAKPEQKTVAWMNPLDDYLSLCKGRGMIPLYAHPKQPLSDENILQIVEGGEALDQFTLIDFARAIEKAHGLE